MSTNTKTTVTVTLPDGTIATRKTARTYTHAVALFTSAETQIRRGHSRIEWLNDQLERGQASAEWVAEQIASAEAKIATAAGFWQVTNWCGRYELALKQAAGWTDAVILEVGA